MCVVCTQDQWCCVTQMHHQRIQTLRQVRRVFEVLLDACHAAHFSLDVQHKSRRRQTHMLSVSVVTHLKSHTKLLKLYYYLWVLWSLQKHPIQTLLEFCSYCYWFKEFERLCKTRTPLENRHRQNPNLGTFLFLSESPYRIVINNIIFTNSERSKKVSNRYRHPLLPQTHTHTTRINADTCRGHN